MTDTNRLIRNQQAVLIGLQATRIAQLEAELEQARIQIAALKAGAAKAPASHVKASA